MARKTTKTVPRALEHLAGCPKVRVVDGEEISAVESYPATQPARGDRPAQEVRVTRCTLCGAHRVDDGASVIEEDGSDGIEEGEV